MSNAAGDWPHTVTTVLNEAMFQMKRISEEYPERNEKLRTMVEQIRNENSIPTKRRNPDTGRMKTYDVRISTTPDNFLLPEIERVIKAHRVENNIPLLKEIAPLEADVFYSKLVAHLENALEHGLDERGRTP